MKEFYSVSEFTFRGFIIKKFTLTEENPMNSSKSVKLQSYSSKTNERTNKFNVLSAGFVAFNMELSVCPFRISNDGVSLRCAPFLPVL